MASFWETLGTITSGFGNRDTGIPGASTNHKGMDIVLNSDNVPAIVGGTVLDKGTSSSAGNWITIQQTDGYTATYMHLAKLPGLAKGSTVNAGQTIGVQGSTGISSGKHLHYQIQNAAGDYIDPSIYNSYDQTVTYNPSIWDAFTGGAQAVPETPGIIGEQMGFIQEKTESALGIVVKGLTLVFVAVVAAFLFFKAFDLKLL